MQANENPRRLSDFELVSQLYAFMQSIPVLWTRDRVQKMFEENDEHQETRGPIDWPLQFEFLVLEQGVKGGEDYLHVLASVSDLGRKKGHHGSSYEPLSTSFLWFKSGELDMPSAREIFEGSFDRLG
ncbi:MAG: hypothetical protein JNM76_13800 [Betaproteobacteria bacterium]|nr:hypothetical protein [Betaproteobacteria bacterium]